MYWPSGERSAAAISGLPKKSSRSRTGGGVSAAPARAPAPRHRPARKAVRTGRVILVKASMSSGTGSGRPVARPAGRTGACGRDCRREARQPEHTTKGASPFPPPCRPWTAGVRPDTFAAVGEEARMARPSAEDSVAEAPELAIPLRAGPLRLVFDRGALRWIRLGEREVLRAIYFALRAENWVTITPELEGP